MKALARSGGNVYEKLRPWLDVPQYVDYMIMWMFGKSEDEYRTTGPVGPGHGYKFVLNDADGFLYYAPYAGPGIDRTARDTPGKRAGDGPGSFFSLLFRDGGSDYRALLADRIHRSFVSPGGAMTPAANIARLNGLCVPIEKSMVIESARWNYQTPAGWDTARANCLNWFNTRTTDILNIYRSTGFYPAVAAPVHSLPGGTVASGSVLQQTTTTSNGVVYYTTDGSDPRPDSGVFNTALVTAASSGKFRVPTGASDGVTLPETPDLVALYPFDGAGMGATDVVGGYNGTLTNGTSINATTFQRGSGSAFFDGINDNIQLGHPANLRLTGQLTFSCWARPASINGIRNLISKGTDTSTAPAGETFLRINAGAWQGGFTVAGSPTVLVAGPATGAGSAFDDIGKWTHLALTYDGVAWRLYRNGVELAATPSASGAPLNAIGWAIGARGPGDLRFYGGYIDEVRIYRRALTAVEIGVIAAGSVTNPSVDWVQPSWPDASWTSFTGPMGFAPAGDLLESVIAVNAGPAMSGVNATLYQRYTFNLTATVKAQLTALEARVKADDGYVLFLNGTRVGGRNVPSPLTGINAATAETADSAAIVAERVNLSAFLNLLVEGTNVLAVQGLNLSPSDDDFLLSAELHAQRGAVGGLTLTRSTLVRSRTWLPSSSTWSALQETFYQVGPSPCPLGSLAVTELHYNPAGDDDGEFIELMNVSDAAINLRGVSFGAGVEFQFPTTRDTVLAPGQRLVLVDSQLTFQRIHGWSAPLGGIYGSSLDNAGGRLLILAADGLTPLVDFTYGQSAPWPDAADGGGRSLVLINPSPSTNPALPANWRVSTRSHGNPNTTDALTFTGNATADLDGDGLSGLLEFSMGTSDAVPNALPAALALDGLGSTITLDHANGADTALPVPQASGDLSLWEIHLQLTTRSLLPDGRLRSTWRATLLPVPDKLYYRFRIP